MKGKVVCAGLLTMFVSMPVLAENDDGWYLGIGVGNASSSGSGIATSNSTAVSGGFGYKFNKNFAFGYETATFDVDNGKEIFSFGGLMATGYIPLNDKFTLLGKLGFGITMNLATSTILGPFSNFTATHFDVPFGAGVEYSLNDNWKLRGTYDRYEIDTSGFFAGTAKLVPVSNLSATITYQF